MNQVYLHFKDICLGSLTQSQGAYVWTPDIVQIEKFATIYSGAIDMFFLNPAKPQIYKQIPYHYSEFVENCERPDFVRQAGIKSTDSDFEKLCKMATLSYFGHDFYISLNK